MNLLKMYIEQKNAGVSLSSILNHIDQLIETKQFDGNRLFELKTIRYQFEQELEVEVNSKNSPTPISQF